MSWFWFHRQTLCPTSSVFWTFQCFTASKMCWTLWVTQTEHFQLRGGNWSPSENMNDLDSPFVSGAQRHTDFLCHGSVCQILKLGNGPPLSESCLQLQEMMKTGSGSQFDLVVFSFQPVEEPFCENECSCLLRLCPPSILSLDDSVLHTDKNTREQIHTQQQNTVHHTEGGSWKD